MSASTSFSIKYDGPALDKHLMDVRELAPALMALSELIDQANSCIFQGAQEVRVNVRGTFKGGSFGVDLVAFQDIAKQVISFLTGEEMTAALNLKTILEAIGLIGGGGLIGLIVKLRGRKPSSITLNGDKAEVVVISDEKTDTFQVSLGTARLFKQKSIRQTIVRVMKPLERAGIESFSVGEDGNPQVVARKEDLPFFEIAASEVQIVSDTTLEGVMLLIENAAFRDDNKWRFNDGGASFHAEIMDPIFLARINSREERFAKGDILIADLRCIQSLTDFGLKKEYQVVHVRKHEEPQQADLL